MDCDRLLDTNVLDDYVNGRLSEQEAAEVELHYFECASCFEQAQTRTLVRQALRRRQARPGRWIALALATAAAAVLAVVTWIRPDPARPSGPPKPAAASPYAELARFSPPAHTPVLMRGEQSAAAAAFDSAMAAYKSADYAAAAAGLAKSLELDPRAAAPRFYLGICQLLQGAPVDGAASLDQVVRLGDTPYLESAHFYLAKAHLSLNRPAEARRHLAQVIALHDRLEPEAAGLLDSIDRTVP